MKYFIYLYILIIFLIPTSDVFANSISGSSAALIKVDIDEVIEEDSRVVKMERVLSRYNSPLTKYSRLIVEASDNYELPWTLVASIAGVESGFCRKMPKRSYNCWGWKNGSHSFVSYEDAIFTVSKTLRNKYFNIGRTNPEKIASIYAPPSNTWSKKVRYFMNLLENIQIPESSLQITL